ncbi:PqqD family protein [Prosthecobacter sp.]|uniref:PqqD family protein n=1 Tax=Prosthecobacter sp. TaxID=1965333 RepID=UPI003784012B
MKLAPLSTLAAPLSQPPHLAAPGVAAPAAAPNTEAASFDFHTVTWQADGFGFDATSGEFFTASPTALLVMQSLSGGMARAQILDRITARFEVARSTAERDLELFLAELVHIGLIKEPN